MDFNLNARLIRQLVNEANFRSIDGMANESPAENNYTTREEVIELMGNVPYDNNSNPSQNMVRFLLSGAQLPSSRRITLRFPEISFEGSPTRHLHFEPNVRIETRLTGSGLITLYEGDVTLAARGAVAAALSENARVRVDDDYVLTGAIHPYDQSLNPEQNHAEALDVYMTLIVNNIIRGERVRPRSLADINDRNFPIPQTAVVDDEGFYLARPENILDSNSQSFVNLIRDFRSLDLPSFEYFRVEVPNLSDIDFSSLIVRFEEINLSNADLTSADLSFANASIAAENHPNRQVVAESTIHTYWFEKAGESTEGLAEKWEALKTENNYIHFATLLTRLARPEGRFVEFNHVQSKAVPAADVVAVIKAVLNSPSISKLVMEEAFGASADCGERPLSLFNTIQGIAEFGNRHSAGATEQELFELAKGIARQTLIDGATDILMTKRWNEGRLASNADGTGPNKKEELEFQMALRHALEKELILPFPVNPLYADNYAQLSQDEINAAKEFINNIMQNEDSLVETLINLPVWVQYMEPKCEEAKVDIARKFDELYDQIESEYDQGVINDGVYGDRMGALPADRQREIDNILSEKTRALYSDLREAVKARAQNAPEQQPVTNDDQEGCVLF